MSVPGSIVSEAAIETLLALAETTPPGRFVEVGVYNGGTAWRLYTLAMVQNRIIDLYDTFTGLPESSPEDAQHGIGDFKAAEGTVEHLRSLMPKAVIHIGVFPETLTDDVVDIAFTHVDCDQYYSISKCIELLFPRMVLGGVMLFDDFDATSGCQKAVGEAFGGRHHMTAQGKAYVVK